MATRRDVLKGAAGLCALGFPAILRGRGDAIRLGHLTPRTGFLGQIGEYGYKGAVLAAEQANGSGGVLGRSIELIAEDSVDPATAVAKAQKLYECDEVVATTGEINSASVAAIVRVSARMKRPHFNTGGNSDEVRGKNCSRYLFHVEGNNTMYVRTIGQWLKESGRIKGARFYFLVADYAFGHDLYRASSQFLTTNGGIEAGKDLIATNTQDFSAYVLKIRQARPDFVFSCLAGIDITNFIRQYREYNLPYEVTGGANDTRLFWAAGIDSLSGHWQAMWYGMDVPGTRAFTRSVRARYDMPPGERCVVPVCRSAHPVAGYRRDWQHRSREDHRLLRQRRKLRRAEGTQRQLRQEPQMLQEMHVMRVNDKSKMQDRWHIFDIVRPVPGPTDALTLIQPSQQDNPCPIAT